MAETLIGRDAERLAGRIAIVVALRAGDPGLAAALEFVRAAGGEVLELAGVGRQASAAIVRRARPSINPTVVDRLVEGAGGNPLMLEELALAGRTFPRRASAVRPRSCVDRASSWRPMASSPSGTACLPKLPSPGSRRRNAGWAGFHRPSRLTCQWPSGEALRRAGSADAEPSLRTTLERADEIGFVPLANRARRSLRQARLYISAATGAQEGERPARMTSREREALGLVGHGLATPEIAGRMGLGRGTVNQIWPRLLARSGLCPAFSPRRSSRRSPIGCTTTSDDSAGRASRHDPSSDQTSSTCWRGSRRA